MSLKTKALLFQLLSFAVLFIISRLLLDAYTGLTGYWIPITAFVIATLLAPQFQAVQTPTGTKLFMKWIFMKGVREIK
jgi:hypothetical protein